MKRQLIRLTFLAALLALFIPAVASAQSRNDPWGRPDYRRDDEYRRDRDYDRYDYRYLRDTINRLDRLAGDFQRELDRSLDRSREDGSRHEDHLNADTRGFRQAVRDLKNSFGNGRDLSRSRDEAGRVVDAAAHVEDSVEHHFNNQRLYSEWMAIREELNVISDAYDLQGGNYGHNTDYRRDRRQSDDDYYRRDRRNDDINRRRDNRNNVPWWQRIPGFPY
ncbi:MAG TPA: hypothetical protein VGQ72_06160 [Pyrinomonadaceae bacterium]|jgi:hypothetical protein|nr:hypothetical protein [Pyrinomonadaceae bacterium]